MEAKESCIAQTEVKCQIVSGNTVERISKKFEQIQEPGTRTNRNEEYENSVHEIRNGNMSDGVEES